MKIEITDKHFDSLLLFYLDGVENLDAGRAKQLLEIIEEVVDTAEWVRNTDEQKRGALAVSNKHSRDNVLQMDDWRITSD